MDEFTSCSTIVALGMDEFTSCSTIVALCMDEFTSCSTIVAISGKDDFALCRLFAAVL